MSTVWYKWTPATTGFYDLDTFGSGFDNTLAVYTGSDVDSLDKAPFWSTNDDNNTQGQYDASTPGGTNPFFWEGQAIVYASAATTYHIQIADCGEGDDGAGPGDYVLNVDHASLNDSFADAADLHDYRNGPNSNKYGYSLVDTNGATKQTGEPNHAGNAGGASVWLRWYAVDSGNVTFSTTGKLTDFDTLLAVYTGSAVNALTSVASNDNYAGMTSSSVTFSAVAGTWYYIAIDGKDGATGIAMLRHAYVDGPPANDMFANAMVLTGTDATASGSFTMSSEQPGEPVDYTPADGDGWIDDSTVWYTWTAPTDGWFTLDDFGSSFDSYADIYQGTSLATLTNVASNDDNWCGGSGESGIGFQATSGSTYYFRIVTGAAGNEDIEPQTVQVHLAQGLPPNDNFADAIAFVGAAPDKVCSNNYGATGETGEPGLPTGETSVWYSWTAPANGVADWDGGAANAGLQDIRGTAYTGSSVSTLTTVPVTWGASGIAWFNAVAGTTYYFQIDATVANEMGYFWLQPNVDPETPSWVHDGESPGNLQWDTSLTSIGGHWNTDDDDPVTQYDWCVQTWSGNGDDNCNYTPDAAGTTTSSTTSFTQTGLTLTEGTTYYVCVRTEMAFNVGDDAKCSDGQTVDVVPPPVITDLTVPSPTTTAPALDWSRPTDDVSGTDYYRVMRSTSPTGPWTQLAADGTVHGSSYSDSTASVGTWYYEVASVDKAGNAQTTFSNVVQVDVIPPAPDAQFTNGTDAQLAPNCGSDACVEPTISSNTPHFSFTNNAVNAVTAQRTQVWTDPLDSDVVGLWHLDTATGVTTDSSGNGNTLTLKNAPTSTAGPPNFNQALTLNGTNQYVNAGTSASYSMATDFTVETWFKTTDLANTGYPSLVVKQDPDTMYDNYALAFDHANSNLDFYITKTNGTFVTAAVPSAGLDDGTWHYVAGTYDGSQSCIYVDGGTADGGMQTCVAATGSMATSPSDPLLIGYDAVGSDEYFDGSIDDVRLSSVARSAATIAGYYATRMPHATILWDSSSSDAGAPLTSCDAATRCEDIVYGGAPLVLDGARYYATAKYKTVDGVWSAWSGPDWFVTDSSITLLVDNGSISLPAALPNTDVTGETTVTITTNAANGYALDAADQSDTWAAQNGSYFVSDDPPACGAPALWSTGAAQGLGITVLGASGGATSRLAKWGAGTGTSATDFVDNKYCGLPATTKALLHERTGFYAAADTVQVGYRVDVDASQHGGAYSDTVTYTAVANA